MKILIVCFSFSGNNRLLAEHLTGRLSADLCFIVEKKRRTILTIFLDMIFRREPIIEPLEKSPAGYDHVVLVSPVWESKVAHPMITFIKNEIAALSDYSFATFCGYARPGQAEMIAKELSALAGHPPKAVLELRTRDLVPGEEK